MIKIIKGKGNYKYFCPKCKTTFETDGEELKECPICEMKEKGNKEDTLTSKIKQVREKLGAVPLDKKTNRNFVLEAFNIMVSEVENDSEEEKERFEKMLDEALEDELSYCVFLLALGNIASRYIHNGKIK